MEIEQSTAIQLANKRASKPILSFHLVAVIEQFSILQSLFLSNVWFGKSIHEILIRLKCIPFGFHKKGVKWPYIHRTLHTLFKCRLNSTETNGNRMTPSTEYFMKFCLAVCSNECLTYLYNFHVCQLPFFRSH